MIVVEKKKLDTLANKMQGLNMKNTRIADAIQALLAKSTIEIIRSTKKSAKNKACEKRQKATLDILNKAKAKGKIRDIGPLLMLSRQCYQSIGYSASRFIYKREISVYSNKEYTAYLQKGTKRMTSSPFLGLSSVDYKNIRSMLIKHAVKQMEEKVW